MAFNDLEKQRIKNAMAEFLAKRRPPTHVRSELDIGYHLTGQSVEIIEIRPQWDNPSILYERSFAKATYLRTQNVWQVFWKRADLRWHGYEPALTVKSFEEFLLTVNADPYGCFFG